MQKPQLLTVWPSLGENILIFIMSIGMGFAFGLVGFLIDGVVLGFIGNAGGFTDQWQDLRYTQAFASIASFCTHMIKMCQKKKSKTTLIRTLICSVLLQITNLRSLIVKVHLKKRALKNLCPN